MKILLLSILIIIIVSLIVIWVSFRSDIREAYVRISENSKTELVSYGYIEYKTGGGDGADVLIIHGAGGGYDQGEVLASAVLDTEFNWIAPSRFGYLRSSLPENATNEDQAHAFMKLLDQLHIDRVAVVALSAGGPSAIHFALIYPERVSSLTLISCGVTSLTGEEIQQAERQGRMLAQIFEKDFYYWVLSNLFRRQLMSLMGARRDIYTDLTASQRLIIDNIIDYMNPASKRYRGVMFDHTMILPGEKITGIVTPTLVIHAEDDTLQPYENALFAVSRIEGARLLSFEEGGHFVSAVQLDAITRELKTHIIENL
ncbi:putative hydrolase protein [Chitinispirillum alkaliphilum]|nr:putative hydrolase protein [Chitinispirillum alkaliphilum]